ncbi:hypothetical protein BDZ89DRAFT_1160873 [Hymenopellis radicata]|nr:hypothetical protein BDZ89DRAFT_1160873 [Hymenopellis radicata]
MSLRPDKNYLFRSRPALRLRSTMDANALAVVVKQVIGPVLIGVVVHALLFGVVVCQYIQYYTLDFKDSRILLATVAWMALIDLLLTINSVALLWNYVIVNFADPTVAGNHRLELQHGAAFLYFVLPVQVFLANRVRKFSGSLILFFALVVLSLGAAAPAWVTSIKFQTDSDVTHRALLLKISYAWGGISVGCDATLTALMTYFLWQKKDRIPELVFSRTNKILNHYIQVGIQSAVPVTICAAMVLILSKTMTTTNIHYVFSVNLGRMYSMTFLTTLNMRIRAREMNGSSSANAVNTLDLQVMNHSRSRQYPGKDMTIAITQTQETHADVDQWSDRGNDNKSKSQIISAL